MKRTKYTPMKGADFTNEPALVDNDRAPICENIIPDHAGYPEKRPGWRMLREYEGKIYGLHKYTFGGVTKMLVHEGNRLWIEDTLLCEDMAENVSRSYQNEDDLIILDGTSYRVFCENAGENPGIPFVKRFKNKALINFNACEKVDRVYIVHTQEKTDISSVDDLPSEYEVFEDVSNYQQFDIQNDGWYTFLIEYEGKFTTCCFYNFVFTGNKMYPYISYDREKHVFSAHDGTSYSCTGCSVVFLGEDGDEEHSCKLNRGDEGLISAPIKDKGYYRFSLERLGSLETREYTFFCDPDDMAFKFYKLDRNDTVDAVVSGYKYTDNGAYIPTTTISNVALHKDNFDAQYVSANGTAYENVSKLSKWRRMTAVAQDAEQDGCYYLCLDDKAVIDMGNKARVPDGDGGTYDHFYVCDSIKVFVNGKPHSVVVSSEGDYVFNEYFGGPINEEIVSVLFCRSERGVCDQKSADRTVLYFPKVASIKSKVVGRDNIEVYYVAEADEDTDIAKCTVISEYDNNLFVTGNPDKPNFDWHSYVENPYYFPDLNYQKFGYNSAVLGYVNTGEYQAVVKADGAAGGSIYIRSVAEFNGQRAYPVKQMASGVGGVSKDGFCSLVGDDLILTKQGIFAVTTIDMTGEKTLSNRSWYVDGKLTKENLKNAVMFVWQGKCMCAVEDRIYILNAESSMSRNHKYDTLYDCYFWTGIPMERVLVNGDELFFSNGCKVCRLNTDKDEKERYSDDGAPIIARWATKLDDDGDITRYKTMIKKGNTVTVKPYARSSAKVYVRTENDVEKEVKYGTADIFSWENIDFSRLTFLTSKTLREIIVNSKVKKYKRLQFIVENDALNEGFGIIEINKHYAYGNFIKR